MADKDQEVPWEGQLVTACCNFALRCRELRESDPYRNWEHWQPVIVQVMATLATEFWDQGFSQSEMDGAFKTAIERLRKYAGSQDRR